MSNVGSVAIDDLRLRVERNQEFVDFWKQHVLRTDRSATTADYDPLPIWHLWQHLIMHELTADGDSILRQVGTRLVRRLGRDPTGKSYTSIVDPERAETALSYLHAVAAWPCGMIVVIEWTYEDGRVERAESVGFPLSKRNDPNGRLMVFCDHALPVDEALRDRLFQDEVFTRVLVVERTFIDIGFGTPDIAADVG